MSEAEKELEAERQALIQDQHDQQDQQDQQLSLQQLYARQQQLFSKQQQLAEEQQRIVEELQDISQKISLYFKGNYLNKN